MDRQRRRERLARSACERQGRCPICSWSIWQKTGDSIARCCGVGQRGDGAATEGLGTTSFGCSGPDGLNVCHEFSNFGGGALRAMRLGVERGEPGPPSSAFDLVPVDAATKWPIRRVGARGRLERGPGAENEHAALLDKAGMQADVHAVRSHPYFRWAKTSNFRRPIG